MKFNQSLQSEIDLLDEDVQQMVEMLASDDEGDRLVAAVNLQQECDEDTIPFLIHALQDSSSSVQLIACLLYTSPSPRDVSSSRMPSSA